MFTKVREITGHAGSVYDLTGDESYVYSASGDTYIAKWNNTLGTQEKFAIKAEKAVYAIHYLKNNNQLVFGCSDGAFHVIDLHQKVEIKNIVQHKVGIFSLFEDEKSKQLFIGDADGNLSVWDTDNWNLKIVLPFNCGKIRKIVKHPNKESIFLCCQDGYIRELDTKRFNELSTWFTHKEGANCLAYFPLKSEICISGGKDGFLRIWNSKTSEKILDLPAHNFGIYSIVFINNGLQFITTSRDKSIKIWDANTLNVIQKIERKQGGHSHAVNACFKLNESEFATAGDDKRIIYWGINI